MKAWSGSTGVAILIALFCGSGFPGEPAREGATSPAAPPGDRRPEFVEVTPELRPAIERGIEYLVSTQDRDTGSFGGREAAGRIAVTGLSCLALMANGSTDSRGRFGANVSASLRYLIRNVSKDLGYIFTAEDDLSRMHGHGFATLALAEAYGMFGVRRTKDDAPARELGDGLRRAVRLIENSQTAEGGWYYEPKPDGNHEGSVTICMLQALRSARNAGIAVRSEVIKRAIGYVEKSQNADGSFAYSLHERRSSVALTAAALATLNAIGEYDGAVVARGMDYLTRNFESNQKRGEWYFYANAYAAQAFYQARDRRVWERFFPMLRDDLLLKQAPDGSWDQPGTQWRSYGPAYSTACALLILQIPYRYLPIFQR